mmetsp:Transcript_26489/g.61793  ORF Transcript_26489/g.61793 Transcript_26489/m.61793 type:complete len:306 (-) Transcript_26489:169-1086(-)
MSEEHEEVEAPEESEDYDDEEEEDDERGSRAQNGSASASHNRGAVADDEEDLEDELMQTACLPVSGAPLPPSDEPPQDADEYLRRVQWERMHCPEIVDVEVEERPLRRRKGRKSQQQQQSGADDEDQEGSNAVSWWAQFMVPELPDATRPSQAWQNDVTAAFRTIRSRCEALREEAARSASAPSALVGLSAEAWRSRFEQERPTAKLLSAQDLIAMHRLLIEAVDVIVDGSESGSDPVFGRGSCLAEWAYAALAFVEEPLMDDMQYNLQRLRRVCHKCLLNGTTPSDKAAAALLYTIVSQVFGQR